MSNTMVDGRAEQWLKDEGLTFEYVEVQSRQIDSDQKIAIQIRADLHGKTDDGNVIGMAMTLERGGQLPAPILTLRKSGRYEPINGIHRLEAHKLFGSKSTFAYVIKEDDPQRLDILRRSSNAYESMLGYGFDQRIEQAMHMVAKDGLTAKAAAEKLGIKRSTLDVRIRAQRVQQELNEAGVVKDIIFSLPLTELDKLGTVRNPNHKAQVVKIAHETKMNAEDRKRFYSEVAEAKTEKEAEAIIARWREEWKSRIGVQLLGRSPFSKLGSVNSWVNKMEKATSEGRIPPQLDVVISLVERTIAALQGLLKQLKRLQIKVA